MRLIAIGLLSFSMLFIGYNHVIPVSQAQSGNSSTFIPGKFVIPEQKIVGAENPIEKGEVVVLQPSKLVATQFLKSYSYSWKIFEVVKDKTGVIQLREKPIAIEGPEGKIVFGSGILDKKMLAILSCSYLFVDQETQEIKNKLVFADVIIGSNPNPEPEPGPGPGPNPEPEPIFTTELAKLSYLWAKNKVQVPKADLLKGATALANSFKSVSSQIGAGAFQKVDEMLLSCNKANTSALNSVGINPTVWAEFSKALQEHLYEKYQQGKLKTVSDYKAEFESVHEGLSKLK